MRTPNGIIAALLLILSFPTVLLADSEALPRSWMKQTKDGQHIFVMLGAHGMRQAELDGEWDTDVPAEYRHSGLYVLGDSSPVYTIDWYALSADVSYDGRYLIRRGPWASKKTDLAVAFYDRGQLLAEHNIDELMLFTVPWQHTVSHFSWQDDWQFDTETNELVISTYSWTEFRFDATTGKITSSFRGDYLFLASLVSGALLLLVLAIRRRQKRRAN